MKPADRKRDKVVRENADRLREDLRSAIEMARSALDQEDHETLEQELSSALLFAGELRGVLNLASDLQEQSA